MILATPKSYKTETCKTKITKTESNKKNRHAHTFNALLSTDKIAERVEKLYFTNELSETVTFNSI